MSASLLVPGESKGYHFLDGAVVDPSTFRNLSDAPIAEVVQRLQKLSDLKTDVFRKEMLVGDNGRNIEREEC
jgi:hypothetical protein